MFDNYVEQITFEIKNLNENLDELKEQLDNDDVNESIEPEPLIVDFNDNQIELLESNNDELLIDLNENLETLISITEANNEQLKENDFHNVQGFWFLFIALTLILGLKIFWDNMLKW